MSIARDASCQDGFSPLLLPLIIASVFLVAAIGFGGWAFANMLDYKNNVDQKVGAAVVTAKQQEDKVKDAAFAEQEKQPLKTYVGPAAYGSVTISYPKTWSGYVADTRDSSPFIDGYFYPGVVPDTSSQSATFALRVQVVDQSYSTVMGTLANFVQQGQSSVRPYALPKVPNVVGAMVSGKLFGSKTGTMVVLPLRNMTLKIWTEAPQFTNDFNTSILPNATFAP